MTKPKVQFAIWEEDSSVDDGGYWALYDTVEDAVSTGGDGTEVFRAEFRSIGRYKRKAVLAQVKNKKRKKR